MRFLLVMVFCVLFSWDSYSQSIKFKKFLGSPSFDFGYSVKQTKDNGYIMCGNTGFMGVTQAYVLKTDSLGNLLWEKTFGDNKITLANSIIETFDSCFVFCGYQLNENNDYDVSLYKIDQNGSLIWNKKFGGADWDFAKSLIQNSDSGYTIAGSTNSFENASQAYVIKTNKFGDLVWENYYGGANDEEINSIEYCSGGGYILCGSTKSLGDPLGDIYIVKINNDGFLEWTKSYGNANGNDFATCIKQISNGDFILSGAYFYSPENHHLAYFLKINSVGDTIFSQLRGSPNEAIGYSVVESNDGGYVWLGKLNLNGSYKAYFYKIDTYGGFRFAFAYGDSFGSDIGFEVNKTKDNGFVCIGTTKNTQNNFTEDIYFFKTDSMGFALENHEFIPTVVYEKIESKKIINLFPNPSNGAFTFELNSLNNDLNISVLDINGRIIKIEYSSIKVSNSGYRYGLKIFDASPGIYFLKYSNSNIVEYQRVVIE